MLVQEQGEELRVISHASRSQSDTEHRYSQTETDALAILWACERFHAYLYGAEFELMTDYNPLECIFSPKSKTCVRIERWLLRMQPYRFTVKYIPGPKYIATVRTPRTNRRIYEVGRPRIDTSCPDNS